MTIKVNDEVIYQAMRWQVISVTSQPQSLDPAVPRVPDQLRLVWGAGSKAIAVSAAANQVTPTGNVITPPPRPDNALWEKAWQEARDGTRSIDEIADDLKAALRALRENQ